MFIDETYSLSELADKLGLPSEEVALGLRRVGAGVPDEAHPRARTHYTYESVWQYVHTFLNHGHFASWQHEAERVGASEMTEAVLGKITRDWSKPARASLDRILASANGSPGVCFMLHRILRIDSECPSCGRFPRIVGYDGRQAARGLVLSIYVCPGCGYLFLKR